MRSETLYEMLNVFLVSKAGKAIFYVQHPPQESNDSNFLVALQALRSKMSFIRSALGVASELTCIYSSDHVAFLTRDLQEAELFLEMAVPERLAEAYADIIYQMILSLLSCRFLDILKVSPGADLAGYFAEQARALKLLFEHFEDVPVNFLFHFVKPSVYVDASQFFRNYELAVLLYDEKGIIYFYVREGVNLKQFGCDARTAFLYINVIYRFCKARLRYICIPEISSTAVMQLQYFDMAEGLKCAVISGAQEPQPAPQLSVQTVPALTIYNLPKRIAGLAVIHLPSGRAIAQGDLDARRLETVYEAMKKNNAFQLYDRKLCDTAWTNGEYCIAIQSEKSELVVGYKYQDQIMAAAYEYFAFRAWMARQSE